MTDLEIIKKNFNIITEVENYDYWDELEKEALDAATRMAAEIERLKAEIIEANKKAKDQGRTACNLFDELKKLQKENRELEAALAEKPDIVRCGECKYFKITKCVDDPAHGPIIKSCEYYAILDNDGQILCPCREPNQFCSEGRRKEAKDED